MHILISMNSIGSFIGAIIIALLSFYGIIYNVLIQKNRYLFHFTILQGSLFLFLFGYAMYSSAINVVSVLFWTKVCYAGAALTIFSSYLFYETLAGANRKYVERIYLIISILLTVLIFLPGELIFVSALNPVKEHSSVIKGPLFRFLVAIILGCIAFTLYSTIYVFFTERDNRRRLIPLVFGLIIWFFSAAFDAVFASLLSLTEAQLWIGPTVFAFSLAIFTGKMNCEQTIELERVKLEKAEIYNNLIKDRLTGLFTREYIKENLIQRISLQERSSRQDTLLFIDIDNFKLINDDLGHKRGDITLSNIGDILLNITRKGDVAARFGGDEFLMLLGDCNESSAIVIAEKIQSDFATYILNEFKDWPHKIEISMSIGVLSHIFWNSNPEDIIHRADIAMYLSKKSGKGRIISYSSGIKQSKQSIS
ncbi:MAG: diguanylate cyclase [Spirochaetales bacterium]|nr:diguanylate cyclase [Spirochaetales bacterium]